jgi:diguanylate cyclase (GGDEF)-like protein
MSIKILVVDDNKLNVKLLKDILEDEKYEVHTLDSGIHVLEKSIDIKPDAILLDIMMPGIDGFEVCRLLKENSETKNIPIIMVTAKTEGEDLKKAFHLGAFDYIKKPIDELEVLARLNSALMFSQQQKKLESMAMKDGLTGLYNHKLSIELFEKEFIKARRHHKSIAFLMLDIDYFKNINDSYGHRVGDEILREVADIIKKNSRVSDIIGRYGGEEFCITLLDISVEEANLVCERIRQAVDSNIFTTKEHSIHITLSIGNCFKYPENPCGYEEVIIQADKALYQAKRLGKNRSETYILENNNG